MKNTIIVGIAGLFVSCTSQTEKGVTISVLDDWTDVHVSQYDTERIIELFNTEVDDWDARCYRYQGITDSEFNPIMELKINAESEMLGNSLDREDILLQFETDIRHIPLRDTTKVFEHSSVWQNIWNEIAFLSVDTTVNVHVYCLTDAREHNYWCSLYSDKTIDQLSSNPETLRSIFFARIPEIEHGAHISLTIVYQPQASEHELFMKIMNELYKPACEKYNISFAIQATL